MTTYLKWVILNSSNEKGARDETWEKNKRVEKSDCRTYPTRIRNRNSLIGNQNDNREYPLKERGESPQPIVNYIIVSFQEQYE